MCQSRTMLQKIQSRQICVIGIEKIAKKTGNATLSTHTHTQQHYSFLQFWNWKGTFQSRSITIKPTFFTTFLRIATVFRVPFRVQSWFCMKFNWANSFFNCPSKLQQHFYLLRLQLNNGLRVVSINKLITARIYNIHIS